MRLDGKTALVTGAGSGIGQAIAIRFAAEGSRVAVAGRTRASVADTVATIRAAGGEAIPVEADVAEADQVAAMVAEALAGLARIDILVNNAGKAIGDDVVAIEPDAWAAELGLVLGSAFMVAREVLPGMLERGCGVIVNIASVNGLTGLGQEPYSAAKAGMINLTQNLAVKYGRFGVRANTVAPATIRTPIWNERLAERPSVFEELARWYPLGRVGEPEEVANAALFLASAEASWITGVTLPVDGGLLAGSYRMNVDLSGGGGDSG